MSFNKWFPHQVEKPAGGLSPESRAWLLRGAWWVSTLMLMAGYVLLFVFWKS